MPVQVPQWTEYLNCPICYYKYNDSNHQPLSLGCGHTACKACLSKLHQSKCPFDQSAIIRDIKLIPPNNALISLVGGKSCAIDNLAHLVGKNNEPHYNNTSKCLEGLAKYLKALSGSGTDSPPANHQPPNTTSTTFSRPMQRKLVSLINCQIAEEEGRSRAMRAARSLGERTVTELILHHQNPQQLSANLWAAVRARGCQFLGPAMQDEVLKLILLALEDGSALSRKVLVLFVVQRLETQYPQASKTAIGHVVQLLYRASCFKVTKRDEKSSLMQLKEEFRSYESLRREHDSQIVQIATEAGLRIAPEQWSSLLYGDTGHKSHMQSIIDKLQTPQSFAQSVNELVIALQRTGDPGNLSRLRLHLELLANIDPSPDTPAPSWPNLEAIMKAAQTVVQGLIEFIQTHTVKKYELPAIHSAKYKTSMCRDYVQKSSCPRGANCTFAHSEDEMERHRIRNKSKRMGKSGYNTPVLQQVITTSTGLPVSLTTSMSSCLTSTAAGTNDVHIKSSVAPSSMIGSSVMSSMSGVTVPSIMTTAAAVSKAMSTLSSSSSAATTVNGQQALCSTAGPVYNSTRQQHESIKTSNGHPYSVHYPGDIGKSIQFPLPPPVGDCGRQERFYRSLMEEIARPNFQPPTSGPGGHCANKILQGLQRRRNELVVQLQDKQEKDECPRPHSSCPQHGVANGNGKYPSNCVSVAELASSVADTLHIARSAGLKVEMSSANKFSKTSILSYPPWSTADDGHRPILIATSDRSLITSQADTMGMKIPHDEDGNERPASRSESVSSFRDEDETLIPFSDIQTVSKYGPISRSARSKLKYTPPLTANALQDLKTLPVTAVTPIDRPYPISSKVPSYFTNVGSTNGVPGQYVAPSPGVHRKPPIMSASRQEPLTLWNVWHNGVEPISKSFIEQEQIKNEIRHLNQQIRIMSDDDRDSYLDGTQFDSLLADDDNETSNNGKRCDI